MNSKNIEKKYGVALNLFFVIFLIAITIRRINYHGILMWGGIDPYFHLQRILEIDYAFKKFELPNWLNFHSFNFAGQAVNGMYPDFMLYPFVITTIWIKNITEQIFVIKSMIIAVAYFLTYITLIRRKVNCTVASLCAFVYVFSGYYSYIFYEQFQPATMLANAIAFPILFTAIDIFKSKKINKLLVIKFALLMTWLLYSHLVSTVVVAIILLFSIIYILIIERKNITFAIIMMSMSAMVTIFNSLPLIYRLFTISKSGLHAPFNAGKVAGTEFISIFTNVSWDGLSGISLIAVFSLVLILSSGELFKYNRVLGLAKLEFLLLILCSSIIPWQLLGKLPFIGNFQFALWRFGIFTSFIPLIMLIYTFNNQRLIKIFSVFFVLCTFVTIGKEYQYHQKYFSNYWLTGVSREQNPMRNTMVLTNQGVNNKTNISDIPDYVPQKVKTISKGSMNDTLSANAVRVLSQHLLISKNGRVEKANIKIVDNGIKLDHFSRLGNGVQLPILGYPSLKYKVLSNGKSVPYKINSHGMLEIKGSANNNITIIHNNPRLYRYLVTLALVLILLEVLCLKRLKNKEIHL